VSWVLLAQIVILGLAGTIFVTIIISEIGKAVKHAKG
jgi:hypothetical protein